MNGDGLADLLLAESNTTGGALLFFALGDGGFVPGPNPGSPDSASVAVGNFSPDGGLGVTYAEFNQASQDQYILYVWPLLPDGGLGADGCPNSICPETGCIGTEEYWGPCGSNLFGQPFLAALPIQGAPDAVIATTQYTSTYDNDYLQVYEQGYEDPGASAANGSSFVPFEETSGYHAGLGPMVVGTVGTNSLADVVVVGSTVTPGAAVGPTLSDNVFWVLLQDIPIATTWPTFSAQFYVTGPDTKPDAVALGDFDENGDQDIAVACYGSSTTPGSQGIQIWLNEGTGVFSLLSTLSTGGPPIGVAVGDFNGDGFPDVAALWDNPVGSGTPGGGLDIFLNNGCGGFLGRSTLQLGDPAPAFVAAGHFFAADSSSDLVIVDYDGTFALYRTGP